jgi:hypothetical protein
MRKTPIVAASALAAGTAGAIILTIGQVGAQATQRTAGHPGSTRGSGSYRLVRSTGMASSSCA